MATACSPKTLQWREAGKKSAAEWTSKEDQQGERKREDPVTI